MNPDFEKGDGLVPVIIQHADTGTVLMLGYMNEEAFVKTKKEGRVTFFSRSKGRLWTKGETSGHYLFAEDILLDCDRDTLLIKARPAGPVCHTGQDTCFGERFDSDAFDFVTHLRGIIHGRRVSPGKESYTSSLFEKGLPKIAQKVGEEAVELVIEAMRNEDERFIGEAADLLFHYLVLLEAKGISFEQIVAELKQRHAK